MRRSVWRYAEGCAEVHGGVRGGTCRCTEVRGGTQRCAEVRGGMWRGTQRYAEVLGGVSLQLIRLCGEVSLQLLGGLGLHLNHLIAKRAANYDWPFGTLPFGLFGSNLDTRDLETYPRTYSGHFWKMSIFDDSRAV